MYRNVLIYTYRGVNCSYLYAELQIELANSNELLFATTLNP